MEQNKLIHENEFRLRVLLTNGCDKDCYFCLNDFQPKEPIKYALLFDLVDCIRAYGSFMKHINETSIITLSGGEPGLYPSLEVVLKYARHYCDIVKVVTNGAALRSKYVPFVDRWHIGVTDKQQPIIEFLEYSNHITIQIVVTNQISYESLLDLVDFYHRKDLLIKLFVDFHAKNKSKLRKRIQRVADHYQNRICTRFTGVQINRGKACNGCKKECVTLKALWYFPDGTSSTCPQGMLEKYDDNSWDETIGKAYKAHLKKPNWKEVRT